MNLMTFDGLPITTRTMLDSTNCCIANGRAATLANFNIELTSNMYKLTWNSTDGFPHVCGSRPTIQIQVCRAQKANRTNGEMVMVCDDVCGRVPSHNIGETVGRCVSSGTFEMRDSEWEGLKEKETKEKGEEGSVFKVKHGTFVAMNEHAVNTLISGSVLGTVGVPSQPDIKDTWVRVSLSSFSGSIKLRLSSGARLA